jgi:cytochrome c peroxidase
VARVRSGSGLRANEHAVKQQRRRVDALASHPLVGRFIAMHGFVTPRLAAGLLVAASFILLAATGGSAPPPPDPRLDYTRPEHIPYPEDNALSDARVELGRALFFDPRLSSSGITSCATCHNPGFDWGDRLPVAVGAGMKPLARRTPTILNLAWGELLFWDGRAETLEDQALGPIQSPDEMNMDLEAMVSTVEDIGGYRELFAEAYPDEPIAKETVAKAIASFERTVVSGTAPFDRWVAGDEQALSPAARRGFDLFDGKANCSSCHAGWRFTDDSFHDVGVETSDIGRGKLFPGVPPLQHAFKTPTLRNVDRRAPYMHNGTEPSLRDVIELYDRGGRVKRESLSEEIRPLELSDAEKGDLLAFLGALSSEDPPVSIPTLPR